MANTGLFVELAIMAPNVCFIPYPVLSPSRPHPVPIPSLSRNYVLPHILSK